MMYHVAVSIGAGRWENLCNERTPRFGNNEGWLELQDILGGFVKQGDHMCPACKAHPDYAILVLAELA